MHTVRIYPLKRFVRPPILWGWGVYSYLSWYGFVETTFWLFFIAAMVVGSFLPQFSVLESWIFYLLIPVLYMVMLKIDVPDVMQHIKRPGLLAYITGMSIIVIPLIAFAVFSFFDQDILVALLLLAVLPAGVTSSVITDILKGAISRSLILTVLTTLLVPLTIPGLYFVLLGQQLQLDYVGMMWSLVQLIIIPLILAQLTKKYFKKTVDRTKKYYSALSVFDMSFIMVIAIGLQSTYIFANPSDVFYLLLVVYLGFALYHVIGYFMVFWLKEEERISTANCNAVMNHFLGLVLALLIFSPRVALVLALSSIPWGTMPAIFKLWKKYAP
jgi:bile acid:Na+ symporter, BASS family